VCGVVGWHRSAGSLLRLLNVKPFQCTHDAEIDWGTAGWDQGVVGMKVGGVRKLVVPHKLGYGMKGSKPDIPAGATLEFEITLKAVTR
jgi:FKBP-type peptidyl-prolyl cis-trans isomerase